MSAEESGEVLLMELTRHQQFLNSYSVCKLKLVPFQAKYLANCDELDHIAIDLFLSVTVVLEVSQ